MNKKLAVLGVVCLVAISASTAEIFHSAVAKNNAANFNDHQTETRRLADLVDKGNTPGWTGEDNTRGSSIAANQPMSDKDFHWAIQKLNLTKADKGSQVGIVTITISALLHANLSPPQAALLDRTALPLLTRNDPVYNDGDIQEYACKVFAKFPNNEAKPQLDALIDSPHPWVRRDAARALAALGENIKIPPRPKTW